MITNDAQLEVVREQLRRIEAALDSLRREVKVKSKNEKLYEVMSRGYIDLLLSIRGDIDAYLGIDPQAVNAEEKYAEIEGVIRSVDLDAQTFILRGRPDQAPDLACEYGKQIEESVKEFLGCRVRVSGTLDRSRLTGREKLEVQAIEAATAEEEPAGSLPATADATPA
jgi:hypothetical protein